MLQLTCLCAAWCRTCDAYAPLLREVGAEFGVVPRWVDIEDEADLVGDVDIATFPTLLVQDGEGVRFYGPVTPHADTLRRLLKNAAAPGTPAAVPAEVRALAQRLSGA